MSVSMTAMAWWMSLSICDTFFVNHANPCLYCRCCLTAAANPVRLVDSGLPVCLDFDCVPLDGGASLAAVLAWGEVLSVVVACCMVPT